ncbi:preprotein translocase subunit SecA [Fusobacterium sp.]|uniref:preprotein translocase subunit SecA n=1 Tax=Fusobacterium sp. TaxID=68766 RepID=UPI0026167F0A|nr:preprotein translocase subunit SecA [Fusobacterium sp.]
MITSLLKMIFGTKNDREIKRIQKKVKLINDLEEKFVNLTDEELKAKTEEFKQRLANGETLDDILVEAFAVVREASKRVLGMRHYDVQLIGGIVLHEGKITEMKTGEGKTLVATCPVYLNALSGKGVHIITVNDYLAKRDKEQMGKVYEFLGLTTGVILNGLENDERKKAYQADVTYGTNSEFGFDYLRDNMVGRVEDKVQRKLNFCIVDEVDSILIDEARTPLIISGAAENTARLYQTFYRIVTYLERSRETEKITDVKKKKEMNIPDEVWKDYEVDEKAKNIVLTEKGIKKVEKMLNIENLYSPETIELTHYLMQCLKAKELFERDKDYLIRENEVVIIDEFTGRALEGRRYSDGLHQAIEAKEGVKIAGENQTLASITLQNYFRMYEKLSGMTGTAETEATEFMFIYGLAVVIIPTNKPVIRKDNGDIIYKTHEEKIEAIVEKIKELYEKGQPVLVGTITIQGSELLSNELKKLNIPHNVLNAKFHEKEAEIVAQAGRYKAVTIATNMAGRGTDIMLGGNAEFMAKSENVSPEEYNEVLKKYKAQCDEEKEKVKALGGLYILGTERHESRRIDNQLRGRSGRQGDPGESQFYLSLEDDLMKLFGSDRVKNVMERLGIPRGEQITHRMITKAIENAQKKVESRNFGIRKSLLEFDDVMNKQREAIYASRNEALSKDDLKETIISMLRGSVQSAVIEKFVGEYKEEWDIKGLSEFLEEKYGYVIENQEEYKAFGIEEYADKLADDLEAKYNEREAEITPEIMRQIEKYVLLEVVDNRWREHLKTLDGLREGIYLRSYGQRDPIVEYKLLSGELYGQMLETIKKETTSYMFKVAIRNSEEETLERISEEEEAKIVENKENIGGPENPEAPCSCGSGKPYNKCCGR